MDSRVRNALLHIGIEIPKVALMQRELYAEIERDLLDQVCRPLQITGAELDQLLFINYDAITARQW
jgi:hypothetical protein